jgi:hypothetical protein
MAKQRIMHGATIDAATPAEVQAIMRDPVAVGDRERAVGYAGLYDVVLGDFDHPEPVLLVSPPARRLRITRHGGGGEAIPVTNVIGPLVTPNEGRMGLEVVNYGANNCFLYLVAMSGLIGSGPFTCPVLWLKSGGGSWDGEFSEGLWGGSVCAKTDTGTTTLAIAEI